MSAVGLGWFDLTAITPDPEYFVAGVMKQMPPAQKAWPFRVSSVRKDGKGLGVAYAIVHGPIPIHLDTKGLDDSDARIWQFVMKTWERPLLLTAPVTERNTPIVLGFKDDDQLPTVGFGGLELAAGMAVHFDISELYHGVSQLPLGPKSLDVYSPPRALIVQVSGFGAGEIEPALDKASEVVAADRGFWTQFRLLR